MVATKMYINTEPTLEAPAPSRFLAFVKLNAIPIVVATTTSQKNPEVRLNFARTG